MVFKSLNGPKGFFIVIGIFLFAILFLESTRNMDEKYTIGKIIAKSRKGKGEISYKYQYYVNKKKYIRYTGGGFPYKMNKSYIVKYARMFPWNSDLNWKLPVPDSIKSSINGWNFREFDSIFYKGVWPNNEYIYDLNSL